MKVFEYAGFVQLSRGGRIMCWWGLRVFLSKCSNADHGPIMAMETVESSVR